MDSKRVGASRSRSIAGGNRNGAAGGSRGDGDGPAFSRDMLAHMADHLLELRDLADRGHLGDLSRLLECAYEEAFVQLHASGMTRRSAR